LGDVSVIPCLPSATTADFLFLLNFNQRRANPYGKDTSRAASPDYGADNPKATNDCACSCLAEAAAARTFSFQARHARDAESGDDSVIAGKNRGAGRRLQPD
jgi:hypothetical protein